MFEFRQFFRKQFGTIEHLKRQEKTMSNSIEKGVPFLFSPRDVGKILSCSRSTVYSLMKTGELKSVHVGRSRKVSETQLVQYIRKLENS
jgi:excisionase family DNA binding protein